MRKNKKAFSIIGPCSAETREQVLETASLIHQSKLPIDVFRAGIWKPRTRPGNFEGVGKKGLKWLQEVKATYGWPIAIEVASAQQVEDALNSEIDVLWIGARTATNPFSVQEVAAALKGTTGPVWIKNPVNPDLDLWIGALERIVQETKGEVGLIHRGFSIFRASEYRNHPTWQIPIEMRRRYPEIPMLLDPSHMAGKRALIPKLMQLGVDLDYDGWMTEVHCQPDQAWSDAAQQFKPIDLYEIIENIAWKQKDKINQGEESLLEQYRQHIDLIDEEFFNILNRRMSISEEIGQLKQQNQLTILQTERVQETIKKWLSLGESKGLSKEFIQKLYEAVHLESIEHQGKKLH